jgi:hypothetical protein
MIQDSALALGAVADFREHGGESSGTVENCLTGCTRFSSKIFS